MLVGHDDNDDDDDDDDDDNDDDGTLQTQWPGLEGGNLSSSVSRGLNRKIIKTRGLQNVHFPSKSTFVLKNV